MGRLGLLLALWEEIGACMKDKQKTELYAEKEIKKFMRKCAPYKIEMGGYTLTYIDFETTKLGEVIMKYKLEKK